MSSREMDLEERREEVSTLGSTAETAILRIQEMECILDQAKGILDTLDAKREELNAMKAKLALLEAYYTSPDWREDFELDEAGMLPENLKRGVLSEDGIWNVLERCREWEK